VELGIKPIGRFGTLLCFDQLQLKSNASKRLAVVFLQKNETKHTFINQFQLKLRLVMYLAFLFLDKNCEDPNAEISFIFTLY